MKKLCQVTSYKQVGTNPDLTPILELRYLEANNREVLVNLPLEFPVDVTCEVLEFNSQEDYNNLVNLVANLTETVSVTQEEFNQFGSLREAAKSKLIGVE